MLGNATYLVMAKAPGREPTVVARLLADLGQAFGQTLDTLGPAFRDLGVCVHRAKTLEEARASLRRVRALGAHGHILDPEGALLPEEGQGPAAAGGRTLLGGFGAAGGPSAPASRPPPSSTPAAEELSFEMSDLGDLPTAAAPPLSMPHAARPAPARPATSGSGHLSLDSVDADDLVLLDGTQEAPPSPAGMAAPAVSTGPAADAFDPSSFSPDEKEEALELAVDLAPPAAATLAPVMGGAMLDEPGHEAPSEAPGTTGRGTRATSSTTPAVPRPSGTHPAVPAGGSGSHPAVPRPSGTHAAVPRSATGTGSQHPAVMARRTTGTARAVTSADLRRASGARAGASALEAFLEGSGTAVLGGWFRERPRLRLVIGFLLATGLAAIPPALHARSVVTTRVKPLLQDLSTAKTYGHILAQLPNQRSAAAIEEAISDVKARYRIYTFLIWFALTGILGFAWLRFF
jgi:hypothetical protein